MSQHDYDLANAAGAAFRTDLNAVLAAIMSLNSGGTEPADTVAYMLWADTSTGMLKIRNAANNAWVDVALMSNFTLPSVQKQLATAFTTTGTSTAYLLTPAPAITANTAGFRFRVAFHTTPSGTPTMAVSGQTALPLKYKDDAGVKQTVTSTQVPANWTADVETDGTDWLVLDIPPAAQGSGSGLDADTLDGLHAASFMLADNGSQNVGSLSLAMVPTISGSITGGNTYSGSSLKVVGLRSTNSGAAGGAAAYAGAALTGTWRALNTTTADSGYYPIALFQRIA